MTDLLVVADDLTGALDTGARSAQQGLRTWVAWAGTPPAEADVFLLDTESRDLAPAEAARRVAELAAPLIPRARRLYKKVDSTLRGNVGAELAALLRVSGASRAILAPAFPAQGRTTRAGRQYVHGAPLPGGPSIVELLAAQTDLSVGVVPLEVVRQGQQALAAALQARPERIAVVDAVEDGDLATIALAAAGSDSLLAGSAGLASWLSAGLGAPAALSAPGPILFVAGTLHPSLPGQLARLQAQAPVAIVGQVLGGLLARGEEVIAERSRTLAAALLAGRDAVVTTAGEPRVAGGGRFVAALLAQVAAGALEQARPGALVLTGGDVAIATCRALGAQAIALSGEVEPGVPIGRLAGGPLDGLTLITKAGGFGDDEVLCRIRSQAGGREP